MYQVLRTVCGPKEMELRITHRYAEEIFYFVEQFDHSGEIRLIEEYGTKKLLGFIFNLWYQTHGQGD